MDVFKWISIGLGAAAAIAGIVVLRGVFRRRLSSASTVHFLRGSLIADVVGLMPLTRYLTPVQRICMLSVFCAGSAIVSWLRFGLLGRWRGIFVLSVTALTYFDVVFVSTRLFGQWSLFTPSGTQPFGMLQIIQSLITAGFIAAGIQAVRRCDAAG